MPRAGSDTAGSTVVESRARSAHDARTVEAGVDSRLAAQSAAHSARHAHAAVLAATAVSKIRVPAAWRRCRGADTRDTGPLNDSQRRTESSPPCDDEYELTRD